MPLVYGFTMNHHTIDCNRHCIIKVYFRRRAVLRRARIFSSSTAQFFSHGKDLSGMLGLAVLNSFERRAAQFSAASARRLK